MGDPQEAGEVTRNSLTGKLACPPPSHGHLRKRSELRPPLGLSQSARARLPALRPLLSQFGDDRCRGG